MVAKLKAEIHTQRLPDKSVQEDAEPETERIDYEGVHRGVLQIEH
jgi:hypothetical protein